MKCTAFFLFVSAVVAVASSPVPLSDLLVEGECDKEECDATAMLQHKRSGVHELDGEEQEDATSRRRKCKQGHFGRPCKQFHGTGSAGGSKTATKTDGSKTVAKSTAPSVWITATSTNGPHTASSASTTVAPPATQVWITATSTKGPHTAGVPATLASSASTTVAPPTAEVPTQITATSTRAPHTVHTGPTYKQVQDCDAATFSWMPHASAVTNSVSKAGDPKNTVENCRIACNGMNKLQGRNTCTGFVHFENPKNCVLVLDTTDFSTIIDFAGMNKANPSGCSIYVSDIKASASTPSASTASAATATTVQLPAACTSGMIAQVAKAMPRCFELCPTLCDPLNAMINTIATAKLVGAAVASARDDVCKNKGAFMCAVNDRMCEYLPPQVTSLGIFLPTTDDELNKQCP